MGLSLLPLDFSLILPVASRLLHLYSTDNKTRLMVKRFSTVRDTQRGSLSYMKEREEGDTGEQEEKKRDSRGER